MKKLSYLIIIVLISSLVLTGCSLLSNISQVPATEQSGITYLTKGGLAPDPSLVGLWHFDTDANDSTAYHNDGMLIGNAHLNTGYFGNAVSFDGTNDYVKIADAPSLNITQGTWEAWIKFDAKPSDAGHPMNPLAKANQYWIHGSRNDLDSDTTDAIVAKICVDGTRYCASTDSGFIEEDVWYHVAGTYDGETLKLYVNGTLVDSNPAPSGDIDTGTQIMAVGTWSTLIDYFCGTIDEVRIWDKALTAEQIEDSANHGIVIQKGMSQDDAFLGDHITTTLEVVTAPESVFITDTLPDELRYIPGTFIVDSVSVEPTVVGQTISCTLAKPCAHTITFDAQVTSAEAEDNTVTNTATAGDASASAALTINPYEGFTKVAMLKSDGDDDGIVEVGEEIKWDVTITVMNIPDDEILSMNNIVVQDRFGGELEIDSFDVYLVGSLVVTVSGKTDKPKIKWNDFILDDGALVIADLIVSTDINPGGQQSYSTLGEYEMNSGAVLKFIDPETGFQLSAHTLPIDVEVFEQL